MLLLWSKAALLSMKIAKSKNFSIALILPKFQRVQASCPTKVWKSKGTHYSRINTCFSVVSRLFWEWRGQCFWLGRCRQNKYLSYSFKIVDDEARTWLWDFPREESGSTIALCT